ncbi:uncharacterized protein LOC121417952 [Lytechinus variegatus]|uniref:uncharacterized protein LOC121417952 n=1 Tax=Lytechinus variegatus TaxID=7654 RepID=UPI001BB1C029|nr:uncharacterized protein LOC121417952 [Lytechinus variegatus]
MRLIRCHVCRYLLISIFVLFLVVNCQARRGSRSRSRIRYGSGSTGSGIGNSPVFWIIFGIIVFFIVVFLIYACCRHSNSQDRKRQQEALQADATQSVQMSNNEGSTPAAGPGHPKVFVQENPLEMPPPSYFDATKPYGIIHRGGGGNTYEMQRVDDVTEKCTGV